MARNQALRCQLITPDRLVLDTEAGSVVFPAHDGQIGVLNNRAPLLCKMGIGICRITTADDTQDYYVDGGFAQMLDNRLTLLTEDARSADEIDLSVAQQELEAARSAPASDLSAQEERSRGIARAGAKIKLARSGS